MPRSGARSARSQAHRPDTVSALERGIAVLRCFEAGTEPLSNSELARLTRIPKPTVTRLAATLVSLGYLKQFPDSERYALSAGVFSLARAFLAALDVRASARPHMAELADAAKGSVYLAVRDGLEMVLIETCRSRSTVLYSRLDVGSRLTIASSALGRAYLLALEPRERETLVRQMRDAGARNWKETEAALKRAMRDAEREGFAMSAGEWHRDINSIAVPLVAPRGEVMALNCGGPAFAFSPDTLRRRIAPRLIETARAIARDMGGEVAGPAGVEPGRGA